MQDRMNWGGRLSTYRDFPRQRERCLLEKRSHQLNCSPKTMQKERRSIVPVVAIIYADYDECRLSVE
jgi:hypothetical protein